MHGEGPAEVPTDGTNLAWRAVELVAEHAGRAPDVRVVLRKGIPVAGGMAGGSADAAGALLGLSALWKLDLTREELSRMAARAGQRRRRSRCTAAPRWARAAARRSSRCCRGTRSTG